MNEWKDESESIDPTTDQSINRSIDQSINQSIYLSINQPICINQLVIRSTLKVSWEKLLSWEKKTKNITDPQKFKECFMNVYYKIF